MTDTQILTLALAVIIPLGLLLVGNSRVTDAKETLRAEIRAASAEGKTLHVEVLAAITALSGKVDLMEQDLKHFFKIIESHEVRITKLDQGK